MNKSKRIAISLAAGVLAAALCMAYGSSIRSQADQAQAETLAKYGGDRIEVRGFGSCSLHFRPPRTCRNPKTGDAVALPGKHVPHFKPGKELRERVTTVVPQPADD